MTTKRIAPPKNLSVVPPEPRLPPTPPELLSQAIAVGAPIDTLERLAALAERFDQREALKAYEAALKRAKASLPIILKTRSASFGAGKAAYRYETLPEIVRVVQPVLQAEGLNHRYRTESLSDGQTKMTCILSHEMGHREESSIIISPDRTGSKNDIQAQGSSWTYAQRMLIKAALGLAADVDDDGAASSSPRIAPAEASYLQKELENVGYPIDAFCKVFGVMSIEMLPTGRFKEALERISKRRKLIEERRKAANERTPEDPGVVSGESGQGDSERSAQSAGQE